METSFLGFNQPFLLQRELWYSTIPHMSFRDLVNLYATAKFADFSTAQENFSIAKRIWCKQVSLITLIDTLYHACVKKADEAFFSIIKTRDDSEKENSHGETRIKKFEIELHDFLKSLLENPDYCSLDEPNYCLLDKPDQLVKIAIIALKAGYVDIFKKCMLFHEFSNENLLRNLLFIPQQDIPFLLHDLRKKLSLEQFGLLLLIVHELHEKIPYNQSELLLWGWVNLSKTNEIFLKEKKIIEFFYKTIRTILYVALCRIVSPINKEGDINSKILINGLNTYKDFSNYGIVWSRYLETLLKFDKEPYARQILKETPFPDPLIESIFQKILPLAVKKNKTQFFKELLDRLENISLSDVNKAFARALKKGRFEIVQAIFERIKERINSEHKLIYKTIEEMQSKMHSEASVEAKVKLLEELVNVICKNTYAAQEIFLQLNKFYIFPQDLHLSDFNLLSSFETKRVDLNGNPVLSRDTSNNRTYICPKKKSLYSRMVEIIKMQPTLVISTILSIASEAFDLLIGIFTMDIPEIKSSVIGIVVVPIAYFGMEVAFLTHFVLPERSSKLYYTCLLSLYNYAPSFWIHTETLIEPSFLHKQLLFELE